MRRLHAMSILFVAVAAAIAAVSFAGSASARRAPTPAKHPKPLPVTAVTLASAPNPSRAGQAILLSGQVLGAKRADVAVQIWRKRPRDSEFQPALSTRADAAGRYAVLVSGAAVSSHGQWDAETHGVPSGP